jgi:hypothetical protein
MKLTKVIEEAKKVIAKKAMKKDKKDKKAKGKK